MLRRLNETLSRFLNKALAKKVTDVERELAAARRNLDVSLADVRAAEKVVAEARAAMRKE
jgi:hypothetical protein